MKRIVIADASALIGLASVEHLFILQGLFGNVQLAPSVLAELKLADLASTGPLLQAALDAGWLSVNSAPTANMSMTGLDAGETESILQALHAHALGDAVLLIIDEQAGRAAAKELGLTIVGTAAVIGMAKQRGLIPSASAVFEALLKTDFRVSADIIRQVLTNVGEWRKNTDA
jgi:predicted nucleic acid-binding protein